MTSIYLYGGEGTFTGRSGVEWNSPTPGSSHKFILFLAQQADEPQQSVAAAQIESLGFAEYVLREGRQIHAEALNDPQMAAFQKHYEGALIDGYSLVWYP